MPIPFPAPRGVRVRRQLSIILLGLAFMTPLAAGSDTPQALWHPVADLPLGVAGSARGIVGGKLLVAGGTAWEGGTKRLPTNVWQYDPAADRWTETGRLSRAFAFGISTPHGSALTLFGGDDGEATRADSLTAASTPPGSSTPSLPRPLAYGGFATAPDGKLYILGGTTAMRDLHETQASFFRFDPATGRADSLPDFPEGPLIHAALAVVQDCVYVFPGGLRDAAHKVIRNSRSGWRYVLATGKWQPLAPYPLSIRGLAARALDDRFVLLAGGLKTVEATSGQSEITGACYLYDTRDNRYTALPALPQPAMLMGLELIDGQVYAFGGEDRAQHRSVAVFRASVRQLVALGLQAN